MYTNWHARHHHRANGSWLFIAAIVFALVVLGHVGMMLIPIVAIVAGTALLWGPVSALSRRVSTPRTVAQPNTQIDARITILESQLESLSREHQMLQETVRWQERLLQHATGGAQIPPAAPSDKK